MKRKTLWLLVSCLMVLSLVIAACGPAATPTTPVSQPPAVSTPTQSTSITPTVSASTPVSTAPITQPTPGGGIAPDLAKPKYGGTLTMSGADITNWDPNRWITGTPQTLLQEPLWSGDWTKGIAGGYGTKQTDWGQGDNDLFDTKIGMLADGWKWSLDSTGAVGTIVITVRKGIHWGLNQNSEASKLVNGREMTTDDVLYSLKRSTDGSYKDAYIYGTNIELRTANITKTAPQEITVTLPAAALITGISRMIGKVFIIPSEVVAKYGDMQNWKNSVATGPFILTEYVPGSQFTLIRNNNYWMTNPIGPGKGDQLPYLDQIKLLVIPDSSTAQAALRTAKLDRASNYTMEDAKKMLSQVPALKWVSASSLQGRGTPAMMRTDKAPFNDIRVRQAMMMATDFQSILKDYRGGEGQIVSFPFSYIKEYGELYVGLNDPDFPPDAKELYVYNPDKAKQLLKDAGYPNGFKASIILSGSSQAPIDYYSIVKGMWAKVGIDLTLDLKDTTVVSNIRLARSHDSMITNTTGPVAVYYVGNPIQGTGQYNLSYIDDPVINAAMIQVRLAAITDLHKSMSIFREQIFKYVLPKAYAIPDVIPSVYTLWWPWLKNYNGEITIGYDNNSWPEFIWYDQALKTSMGY